jgi:hypothetical protein
MNIETLGHAALLLRNDKNEPVLLSHPWLKGSCYWRSWWLQNYPSEAEWEEVNRVKYCYVTHEHPDHFHTYTIRKMNDKIQFLAPLLAEDNITKFLGEIGKKAKALEYLKWHTLTDSIRVLSIPLYNDDSVLLIDTPTAFIINQNDSKPQKVQWNRLVKFLDEHCPPGKKRILLSSYSPASIVNSFLRNSERISMKEKKDYIEYICGNCDLLKIDYFMPFASQVIFYRSDSNWANSFKVAYSDAQQYWKSKTKLVPPYSKIDLTTFEITSKDPAAYNHHPEKYIEKAKEFEARDKSAVFTGEDIEKLRQKMNRNRFFFCMLFPRGFSFDLENTFIYYNPWSRKIKQTSEKQKGHFSLIIPRQALKDVLDFNHFGDLGITMFTLIVLNKSTSPRMIYLFFIVITFHDYNHTNSFRNFMKWMKENWKVQRWNIPALN